MSSIDKLPTYIPGFDLVSDGGLPRGRTTLLSGTSGSAKTVLAAQFLIEGIRQASEAGVFVTFEEPPTDIRVNMRGFGWDIAAAEEAGHWRFVDASPEPGEQPVVAGEYDLGALIARIENAVAHINASRVVLDSLGGIYSQFNDSSVVRREVFRIAAALKKLRVTSIITAERVEEHGPISRYGVEEFVTDNVVVLRNLLEMEKRRRTVEILKFRGTSHQKGEFPFTVSTHAGIVVVPLSAIQLKQPSTDLRITSGNTVLDEMCGGGFFRDSILLISGPTGTGKTLLSTEFLAGGMRQGERCLLFAFEESREQLFRNAIGRGVDLEALEASGLLRVVCEYPEAAVLEDHLIRMKDDINSFDPQRIAVDSLSALERVSTAKTFREFVISLTAHIKDRETAGLFTSTTTNLLGGASVAEAHISTITDAIILLRYVEMYGEMRRGLTVLKMRGSTHDKQIREFVIDGSGLRIGRPFRNILGILSGNLVQVAQDELDRMQNMFDQDPPVTTSPPQ